MLYVVFVSPLIVEEAKHEALGKNIFCTDEVHDSIPY